jgi:hypothetical protein
MGLLSGVLGTREEHPTLPEDSYAKQRIEGIREELQNLLDETKDRIEIVPAQHAAYVFIGKPPKTFGLAWIHDGQISNLAALAQERKINPIKRERIDDALRNAYKNSQSEQRYTLEFGEQSIVVTPSQSLEQEVHEVIESAFS